ncbi:MAG: helicase [Actinomycetota bacterium]|nr:helicase [Actinomycetota bacterium]
MAAASMAVIAALAMGCADLARVLVVVGRADTAADAAALATAQELVLPTGRVPSDVAAEYADDNGADLVECRCDAGTGEAVVTVRMDVGPMLLVPGGRTVTAQARAVVASESG